MTLVVAFVVLVVLARVALRIAAEVTVGAAFFDALGMGDVYATRVRWGVGLGVVAGIVTLVMCLPVLFLAPSARADAGDDDRVESSPEEPGPLTEEEIARIARHLDPADLTRERPPRGTGGWTAHARQARRLGQAAFAVTVMLVAGIVIPTAVGARDTLLAGLNAQPFGVTEPVFGHDVAFTVFTVPAWQAVIRMLAVGLGIASVAVVLTGVALWYGESQNGSRRRAERIAARTLTMGLAVGGAWLVTLGAAMWLSRYGLLSGRGLAIAGPTEAARRVDIPTRAVGGIALMLLGAALAFAAIRPLRRFLVPSRVGPAALAALAFWGAVAVALTLVSTVWWLVLLAAVVAALVALHRSLPARDAARPLPPWAAPTFALGSVVLMAMAGPLGTVLYDAAVLRGPRFEVERAPITDTLRASRDATGLAAARVVAYPGVPGPITQAGLQASPASLGSLRVVDVGAARSACRSEAGSGVNRLYACEDIDINRMTVGGRRLTVFVAGREIDYARSTEFSQRHLTRTHGYGVLVAPVDRVAANGRPEWIANGIPQRGISPAIAHPEIYFGAQPSVPWALVNTTLRGLDAGSPNRVIDDWCHGADAQAACGRAGGTGISVAGLWRRFAVSQVLGGMPLVGEGRRVWAATDANTATDRTRLLLHRDIRARLGEMAPFLVPDSDPYFAAAGGRIWVVVPAYVATSRYPHAAAFGGANYMRQPVLAAMDAYSGETHLFVTDDEEPMLATWRAVYPGLFTPAARMDALAPGLADQVRLGEDLFDFQSAATERFHVADPEEFWNDTQAWTPGLQQVGAQDGQVSAAAARYTYLRPQGRSDESFAVMRTFTLASTDAGRTVAGWLVASSEPQDLGRLTLTTFSGSDGPPSLATFTTLIGRDEELTRQLALQPHRQRGDAMVVPVDRGVLYALPIYVTSQGTGSGAAEPVVGLLRVVVSDGARIEAGRTLDAALAALTGRSEPGPAASTGGGPLIAQARAELRAFNAANARGDYAAAGRHLDRLNRLLGAAATRPAEPSP